MQQLAQQRCSHRNNLPPQLSNQHSFSLDLILLLLLQLLLTNRRYNLLKQPQRIPAVLLTLGLKCNQQLALSVLPQQRQPDQPELLLPEPESHKEALPLQAQHEPHSLPHPP